MEEFDAIIIGAGHNGLITQAYLSRSGLRTISLESAPVAGGGLSTIEDPNFPGFFHNTHAFYHRGITNMPWFKDLDLERHGLEYIGADLYASLISQNGSVIQWWTDFEKTYKSFAALDRDDADTLRKWRDSFVPISRDILSVEARTAPIPADVRQRELERTPEGRLLIEVSRRSPFEFVTQEFKHPQIQAALLFINGMREVDLRASGFGHHIASLFASPARVQTPRGGAAALAKALVRAVESHGGVVRTNAQVTRILIENNQAVGVELADGSQLRARKLVASSLNPHLTFLDLVGADRLPQDVADKVKGFKYNVLGPLFSLHLNLSEAPVYRVSDEHPDVQQSLTVIMGIDNVATFLDIVRAHDEGRPGPQVLWGGTPTAFDPSQAPAGKHTAFMWEKTPYALHGDPDNWLAERERHAQRMFDTWATYAPNLHTATISSFSQSPREVALNNPNMREADVLMGAFTNGQIGINRPFEGAGNYRTFVNRLYLCGSASHPGGNITGLPGFIAAREMLSDQMGA